MNLAEKIFKCSKFFEQIRTFVRNFTAKNKPRPSGSVGLGLGLVKVKLSSSSVQLQP